MIFFLAAHSFAGQSSNRIGCRSRLRQCFLLADRTHLCYGDILHAFVCDCMKYLTSIFLQVRIAQLESDNAELKFAASKSEFEAAENKARAASHRSPDVLSKQQLSEMNQQNASASTKAVVSVGGGVTVGGSPVVTKEQQPAKIEIANDEEDVRAYAKVLFMPVL
jgi:hypothetical protein